MSLTIKQFTVLNTTTGKMQPSGRYTSAQYSPVLSHKTMLEGTIEKQAIVGMPTEIDISEAIYGKSHLCTKYIEITDDINSNTLTDAVFVPDNYIRIALIGGTTGGNVSVLYAFTDASNNINSTISWNVLMAKTNAQTVGDYFDIVLPQKYLYKKLHLALMIVNRAWDFRTIVSGKKCTMYTTPSLFQFSLLSSQNTPDADQAHHIICQGKNTNTSIYTRVVVCSDDWNMKWSDKDYHDVILSVSSRVMGASQMYETHVL